MSDTRDYSRILQWSAALMLLLASSACQMMPTAADPEPEPAPVPEPVEEPSAPPPPPPATLQQAVDFLDMGETEAAEDVLERILQRSPGSRIAQRFLDQIRSDPLATMGEDYREVQVQAGESLSVIAYRELGDSLQFFALARYNQIQVPRRLAPGMTIRIPDSLRQESVDRPALEPGPDGLETAGEEEAIVESETIDEETLVRQRRAGVLYAEGLNERQAGNLYLALSRFDEALELDPSLVAAVDAASVTRSELVSRLHEQAVSLYRNHQINDAIASWEEALQLDPTFEPAQVNLERARAVAERLRELDD
ncbi:MAG: LysM domain-containing protein [Wenzhouxiangella sp.]|nr:MAG: LysM domain-containing protein [Wenzhouxiangella sp.]